jgi:5-hydroxyisourate hydrolase
MTKKNLLSTHILDLSLGQAASHVSVQLEFQTSSSKWKILNKTKTNLEGRVQNLLPAQFALKAGCYRLTFGTQEYFLKTKRTCFFPVALIVFQVTDPQQHYHIPLLLSPYGYSTYRGT